MATAEILLLQPIQSLGGEGDKVKVRAGYARNFLLPRNIAVPVNRANIKQIEALQKRRAEREAQERDHAEEVAAKLKTFSIAIPVKTGEGGKMFGAVTAADLLQRLKEEGVELEKKKLSLHTPLKKLGKHTTRIKLHPEVSVDFEFEIVSENPIDAPASEEA